MDGHVLPESTVGREREFLHEPIVLLVRGTEATAFTSQMTTAPCVSGCVLEVEFDGLPIGIPVGDGVDDLVPGEHVSVILEDVPDVDGLIVGQGTAFDLVLDLGCDLLQLEPGARSLDALDVPSPTASTSRQPYSSILRNDT